MEGGCSALCTKASRSEAPTGPGLRRVDRSMAARLRAGDSAWAPSRSCPPPLPAPPLPSFLGVSICFTISLRLMLLLRVGLSLLQRFTLGGGGGTPAPPRPTTRLLEAELRRSRG